MITILFFFLGTCLGSFLGLVFYRYPEKSIILPKSYCDTCSHPLRYRDLIPIFSYLLNRAKCPFCHTKVRILYLFIEVFCGVSFLLAHYQLGLSWVETFVLYISLLLSLYDCQSYSYPFLLWILFTLSLLVLFPFTLLSFIFLLLAFLARLKSGFIGSGDFLYLASLALVFDLEKILWIVQIASSLGIFYCLIFRKKRLPLIPFLTFAVLIISFITN